MTQLYYAIYCCVAAGAACDNLSHHIIVILGQKGIDYCKFSCYMQRSAKALLVTRGLPLRDRGER